MQHLKMFFDPWRTHVHSKSTTDIDIASPASTTSAAIAAASAAASAAVSVEPYYSESLQGSASITITSSDTVVTWTDAKHCVVGVAPRISHLRPGVYTVRVHDPGRRHHDHAVCVPHSGIPTVCGYDTHQASHEGAWDGRVVAHVSGVTTHTFLWSTGAITIVPELVDVAPGNYSASILDARHQAVPYVHACCGATVDSRD